MGLQSLSLLLSLASLPAESFVFHSSWSGFHRPTHVAFVREAASSLATSRSGPKSRNYINSRFSMELEVVPMDRRDLIRALGGAIASLTVATSTLTADPERSSAASVMAAVAAPAAAKRPGKKRSPAFLCDDTVSYLYNPTKKSEIWIVGTAHVSNSSARLVENTIREIKPQVVMVELDAQRVGSFLEESMKGESKEATAEGGGTATPPPTERKRTPFFGTFFRKLLAPGVSVNDRVTDFFAAALGKAISKMYESMDQKGLVSGQEFTIAIREARACGAKLLLGDQDVQVTLRRLSQALRSIDLQALSETSQLETGLGLESLDSSSAVSITTGLEKLKNRETMRKVVGFYRQEAPELYKAMIGERDKVMAVNLMTLEGQQTTVAVVGLAHADGIEGILAANGWEPQRC